MSVITGYYLETQDVNEIEMIIDKMRSEIRKIATKEYYKLLSEEIQNLVDYIAIGSINRPECDIMTAARNELSERIGFATFKQNKTRYNFNVNINILYMENKTYFKFNANNNIYKKALNKVGGLIPYDLDEQEYMDPANKKTITWRDLMDKYSVDAPMSVQLIKGILPEEIDFDKLKFDSIQDRADSIARHNLTTQILNAYGREMQIPSFCLMDYFDKAISDLMSDSNKQELKDIKDNLIKNNLIVDITKDLIIPEKKEN